MSKIPEWAFTGGYFRPGFSSNDVPKPWSQISGKWKREEMVPFGKASEEYRFQYFHCPECDTGRLKPLDKEYRFGCSNCPLRFGWGFGSLHEKYD